jgi:hypothetical protein
MMHKFNIKKVKYDVDQIIGYFGIEVVHNDDYLQKWLSVAFPPNFEIPELLEEKRKLLVYEGALWNEEELKMHFLSIVFSYANMEVNKKIKLFYERPLAGIVQDVPLSVVCDALLARPYGINTPAAPYFFLQEFKKGKKATDDAEGQMLIAMLIAQELNNDGQTVYGCYLQGKDWYFCVLHERQYSFSKAYDATQPDELKQILAILAHLKQLILSQSEKN